MTCIRFPRILLFLVSFSSLVAAANFAQCLEEFRNNPSAVGGVDSRGHPTSPAAAVGLTYQTCIEWCGSDAESFRWNEFTQSFSSWLLPWLALLVVMSVGSPALAAYSLVLTSLNTRSVYRRASRVSHGSRTAVTNALISLQQTSFELTTDERLLAFIPINDQWKWEVAGRLNRRNTWSLATGPSVAWVSIAFLFAIVGSFLSLNPADDSYEGHALGTLWLWLPCLAIGWMWVPTFSSAELKVASGYQRAAKGATKRLKTTGEAAKRFLNPARRKTVNKPAQGAENQGNPRDAGKEPDWSVNLGTNPNQSVVSLARSAQDQMDPEMDQLLISKDLGSLNRDEHRLSATFNYSRIMRYLVLVDDVLTALDRLTRGRDEKGKSALGVVPTRPAEKVVFPPGAFISMFNAAVMALILQCGTTVAATIIMIFTPTVGLGCRSLGYIIYGGTAVVILFLNIISTIVARISETRERSTVVKAFTAFIAIAFRRISFLLALANGTGLIVLSCFQFSHFLDNCYCNASVLSRSADSYMTVLYDGSVTAMRNSRIVGTVLSGVVVGIYMIFLRFMTSLPVNINDL